MQHKQWYKSVNLVLAANRGHKITHRSSLAHPSFRVSLKHKEKQDGDMSNLLLALINAASHLWPHHDNTLPQMGNSMSVKLNDVS